MARALALRGNCGEDEADAETSLPERCVVSLRDRFTGRQCSANKSAPPYTRLIAIVLHAPAAAYAVATRLCDATTKCVSRLAAIHSRCMEPTFSVL